MRDGAKVEVGQRVVDTHRKCQDPRAYPSTGPVTWRERGFDGAVRWGIGNWVGCSAEVMEGIGGIVLGVWAGGDLEEMR